jgi:hypothetical protein
MINHSVMKRQMLFFSLCLITGIVCAQELTLDQVLDNHFAAIGQDLLLKTETIRMSGKVRQMGMVLPYVQIQKRPNKSRLEVEMQGDTMIQAYDGESGWAFKPWLGPKPQQLAGTDLKGVIETGNFDGDFWKWHEKGLQVQLIGREILEGNPVYNIKVTKKDGDIYNYYLDTENFTILSVKTRLLIEGRQLSGETILSNYKEVDDILFPFSIETKYNGKTVMLIDVESIELNQEYDDSLFRKPVE